jgi:hypothetical protein
MIIASLMIAQEISYLKSLLKTGIDNKRKLYANSMLPINSQTKSYVKNSKNNTEQTSNGETSNFLAEK